MLALLAGDGLAPLLVPDAEMLAAGELAAGELAAGVVVTPPLVAPAAGEVLAVEPVDAPPALLAAGACALGLTAGSVAAGTTWDEAGAAPPVCPQAASKSVAVSASARRVIVVHHYSGCREVCVAQQQEPFPMNQALTYH